MTVHLCFHGIGTCDAEREPGEARYWVSQDMFRRILDLTLAADDVHLSFDDGNRSDIEMALPALAERGLTATFFALAGRLDDPASLGASDLLALRDAGMTIGSHGWRHVPWRGLTETAAASELIDARRALEEASGTVITEAALPLGQYDRRVLDRLRRERYRVVYSSDRYTSRRSAWLRARYSVTFDDTVASVTAILRQRSSIVEAVHHAKSVVKRVR